MDLGLAGKRALVMGASSGLGAATAKALAVEGVAVVINGRDRARLEAMASRIHEGCGAEVGLAVGDVSAAIKLGKIVDAAREHFDGGEIDILVSNSGGPPPGPFLDHSTEDWTDAGRLLLDSAVGLTRAVLPGMLERGWGRLIYVTSVAVLQPVDDLILSNSYRAGVTGFCKSISNSYAARGITANCVCPGYTATERLKSLINRRSEATGRSLTEVEEQFISEVPVGRLGQPDELASLVTFLASDRAAYITGASIAVDGGMYRGLL